MATMTPIVMVLGDDDIARAATLVAEAIDELEQLRRDQPELDELCHRNGWTNEMLAWGSIVREYLDELGAS